MDAYIKYFATELYISGRISQQFPRALPRFEAMVHRMRKNMGPIEIASYFNVLNTYIENISIPGGSKRLQTEAIVYFVDKIAVQ